MEKLFVWGIYDLFDRNGLLTWIFARNGITPNQTAAAVLIGVGILFCVLISYLLGSINFALVVSKLFYHDDVRNHGSGNAGATNITRTYGKKAGLLTFLGDGLKGVVSILIACLIFGNLLPHLITVCYLSAFTCILGHVFPCFSHFRGGKGFATTALCVLVLNPIIFAILAVIFFALVAGTRYVSLGSVVTVLFYPVLLSSFDTMFSHYGVSVLFSLLIAALVTWAHRGNLKRIREGTERKFGESKASSAPPAEEAPAQSEDEDENNENT